MMWLIWLWCEWYDMICDIIWYMIWYMIWCDKLLGIPIIQIFKRLSTVHLLSSLQEMSIWKPKWKAEETCLDFSPYLCSCIYLTLLWWGQRMAEMYPKARSSLLSMQQKCKGGLSDSRTISLPRASSFNVSTWDWAVTLDLGWLGVPVSWWLLMHLFKMFYFIFRAKYARKRVLSLWQISFQTGLVLNELRPLNSFHWGAESGWNVILNRKDQYFIYYNKP